VARNKAFLYRIAFEIEGYDWNAVRQRPDDSHCRGALRAYQVDLAGDEIGRHGREHGGIAIGRTRKDLELLRAQPAGPQTALNGGDARSHGRLQTRI
jgi:hypothetical protein